MDPKNVVKFSWPIEERHRFRCLLLRPFGPSDHLAETDTKSPETAGQDKSSSGLLGASLRRSFDVR